MLESFENKFRLEMFFFKYILRSQTQHLTPKALKWKPYKNILVEIAVKCNILPFSQRTRPDLLLKWWRRE